MSKKNNPNEEISLEDNIIEDISLANKALLEISQEAVQDEENAPIQAMSIMAASSEIWDKKTLKLPVLPTKTAQYDNAPFKLGAGAIENINTASGALEYNATDLVLPGKNGFDLVIERRYDSSAANKEKVLIIKADNSEDKSKAYYVCMLNGSVYEMYGFYGSVGEARNAANAYMLSKNLSSANCRGEEKTIDVYTTTTDRLTNDHALKKHGLGYGWSFNFPSIETCYKYIQWNSVPEYYVLHLGDGRSYKIDLNSEYGSGLEDYKLKDIWVTPNGGGYILNYKDGRTAEFEKVVNPANASEYIRNLTKMKDRFGNTISFEYNNGRLSSIVDSYGVRIDFVLSGTSMKLINRGNNQTECEYITINNQLKQFKDKLGNITSFNYETPSTTIMLNQSICGDTPETMSYHNLTEIIYPTGACTQYIYEAKRENQNVPYRDGAHRGFFAVVDRKDYTTTAKTEYKNHCTYLYNMNININPMPQRRESYADDYIKSCTITNPAGLTTTRTYNDKHQLIEEMLKSGVANVSKTTFAYGGELHNDRLPILLTNQNFSLVNQGASVTTSTSTVYSDDKKANPIQVTQTYSDNFYQNQTTFMQYDGRYNMLLSKRYKKDANTEIIEEYILDAQGKKVELKRIFEGSVLKEKTRVIYDQGNNVIEERRYYENLELENSYCSTVFAYNAKTSAPTEKTIFGVKDIDGNLIPSPYGNGVSKQTIAYDYYGRAISQTDPNGMTTFFEYNALGQITKETYPDGTFKETQYIVSLSQNYVVERNKDINGTVLRGKRLEYTSLGKIERVYMLTPDKRIFYNVYNSRNLLWYEYTDCTEGTATTVYEYDALDRVTTKTTTGGRMTEYQEIYSYDDAFDPARQYVKETKEIVGEADKVENGIVVKSSAPTVVSSVLKDVRGMVREETLGSATTLSSYDYIGNKVSQTDPNGNTTTFAYDYAGRALSETRLSDVYQPDGSVAVKNVVATTVYDPLGNKLSFTDFRGKTTTFSYDVQGRLLEQKSDFYGTDKTIARYLYNPVGNITSQKVLCASGIWRETAYTYDNRNRVVDTIVNDGKAETRTRFEYDAIGNKTTIYMGMLGNSTSGAQKTAYTHDRFGNVLTMTDPTGGKEVYDYDIYGQLSSKVDRNGDTTNYEYDSVGKLRLQRAVDSVDSDKKHPNPFCNYSYTKTGQKASEDNAEIRISLTYDNMGRLITQTESCISGAANTVVKIYGYDGCNNRTSFVMKKDGVTQISLIYGYDRQNRLKNLWKSTQHIAAYAYDENGNRKLLSYPQSGISAEYSYNDANLVTDLQNKKGGVHRSSYHYSYILDGNQSRKISEMSGKTDKTTDYTYDRLGRLTEEKEQNGDKISYEYDRFGNRSKMTVTDVNGKITATTYKYDLRNRLETETKVDYKNITELLHYRYDQNGNQIYREWERLSPNDSNPQKVPGKVGFYSDKFKQDVAILEMREYNSFNQLVYLYRDTLETKYSYRPDGLRHKKLFADGSSHTHLWDGQNIIVEYAANGNLFARYLRGINLIAREQDNLLQYYLFNAHGDVVERTDHNGTTLKNYDYDAFGVEKNPEVLDANPFRYCGEYFDREADTYYLRARNYSARNGRFTSEDTHWNPLNMLYGDNPKKINEQQDPLGLNIYTYVPDLNALTQSSNLYSYCGNNPVLYIDEDGELAILATMAIGAGLGALISGGIELGSQLLSGTQWSDVQWGKVGIEAASGALSGALAGSGVGLIGQIAGNAAISAISNAATQKIYNGNINFGEVAKEAGMGAILGAIGGPGVFHGAHKVHVTYVMEGSHLLRRTFFHYTDSKIAATALKELTKGFAKGLRDEYTIRMIDKYTFEILA